MSTQVNFEEIKSKLYEKLKPSGWGDKLRVFLLSEEFESILRELWNQSQKGDRFTPVLKQVFRAFEECPYSKLRIVMISQDPYPAINQADGIAFSCSNTMKAAVSLRNIFDEIQRTVYTDSEYVRDPDLKRWANQGILMFNTALTTPIGKIGEHLELWKFFTTFVLDTLNSYNSGLIYVFLGSKAKNFENLIGDHNDKLFVTHPAYAAYTRSKTWETDDLFPRLNELMKQKYGDSIKW